MKEIGYGCTRLCGTWVLNFLPVLLLSSRLGWSYMGLSLGNALQALAGACRALKEDTDPAGQPNALWVAGTHPTHSFSIATAFLGNTRP